MPDLEALYNFRFKESELPQKNQIWKVLCRDFFDSRIPVNGTVVDLACGYGEFINNIRADRKIGVDLNKAVRSYLDDNVEFYNIRASDLSPIGSGVVDVVFTSNFLEHLHTKEECDSVLAAVLNVLKPAGRFIIMGPNIKYLASAYWDFYDHYLPLSHLSLQEGLAQAGYEIESVVPRFLPYTTRSALPKNTFLISAYLKLPLAWPVMGKQFLVTGRRPA